MFGKPMGVVGALTAVAAAMVVPVVAAPPASAETFGQYQQACFNTGTRGSDPYYPGMLIPSVSLVEGDTGVCVSYLQELLDTRGWWFNGGYPYSVSIDGQFGPKTNAAVLSFQKGSGLQVDGEVGPLTWTALGSARD